LIHRIAHCAFLPTVGTLWMALNRYFFFTGSLMYVSWPDKKESVSLS
jgi:hypothetical protein